MAKAQHQLLIGLPGTGKTTYLAALWHVVQQLDLPTALTLERLEGDAKYVNDICKRWLSCEPVPRTNPESETTVSMHLQDPITARSTTLLFPDLSGESFELQWSTRQLPKTLDKQVRVAAGALVFVNPISVVEPMRIDQVDLAISGLEQFAVPVVSPAAEEPGLPMGWSAEHAPTQVQLVEILQFLLGRLPYGTKFRLAIMISAWDRIASEPLTPRQWLDQRLPLLAQYLVANQKTFEHAAFGVSAQGGEYTTQSVELVKKRPTDRIQLVGDAVTRAQDLTEPVHWLMQ